MKPHDLAEFLARLCLFGSESDRNAEIAVRIKCIECGAINQLSGNLPVVSLTDHDTGEHFIALIDPDLINPNYFSKGFDARSPEWAPTNWGNRGDDMA